MVAIDSTLASRVPDLLPISTGSAMCHFCFLAYGRHHLHMRALDRQNCSRQGERRSGWFAPLQVAAVFGVPNLELRNLPVASLSQGKTGLTPKRLLEAEAELRPPSPCALSDSLPPREL